MKAVYLFLLCIACLNIYGQNYFVCAENGLNVRADTSLSSEIIAKISFGVLVEQVSDTDKKITINDDGNDITGNWVKIKFNNYLYLVNEKNEPYEAEGFVFDAFLQKLTEKDFFNTAAIHKNEYDSLKEQSSTKKHQENKIGNLDSIKTILKNRVEWFSEHESDYGKIDHIKTIKTSAGHQLILNPLISEDYSFSEGFSGYYPQYDILVMEGGHSMDIAFSIETGASEVTIGNPEYIVTSPKNTYRLNGYWEGQECVSYFFQKNVNGKFVYHTKFNWNYEICTFKEFTWVDESTFIYSIMDYDTAAKSEMEKYFKGTMN